MSANPSHITILDKGEFTQSELERKALYYEWTLRNRLDGSVLERGDADEKPDAIGAARLHFVRHEERFAAEVEQARQAEEARKARINAHQARAMEIRRLKMIGELGMIPPPAEVTPTRSADDATKAEGKSEIWATFATDAIERLRYVESDALTCEGVPDECTARRAADLRLKVEAGLIGEFVNVGDAAPILVSAFQIADHIEPLEAKVSEWRGLKPAERGKIAFVYAACERALSEGKTLTPVAIETYRSRDWGMETPTDAPDSTIKGAFGKAKDVAADWHPIIADMVSDATGKTRGRGGGNRKTV